MLSTNINGISEKLLLTVKKQEPTDALLSQLANLQLPLVQSELSNDDLKKAFWINIYNSFFQILRKVNRVENSTIFTQKLILIANTWWSLDDIEHGILRRFRYKFSLGYLPHLFISNRIKELAVLEFDYRIHFALNCGAKSCPPIAFYSANNIEQQLEMATSSFLDSETDIDDEKKEIHISRLFLWFLADFRGRRGIRNILEEKLDQNTDEYKLRFRKYSWDEQLDNYSDAFMESSSKIQVI
jgi:hypothetical protein